MSAFGDSFGSTSKTTDLGETVSVEITKIEIVETSVIETVEVT